MKATSLSVAGRSAEQGDEPNGLLYRKWKRVFQSIPEFEDCLCLRRVRCPDRGRDMDFLLLNQVKPALGLVECEGLKHRVPQGVEQLLTYLNAFLQYAGDGETILEVSIRDALEGKNKRADVNCRYGSVAGWLRKQGSQIKDEAGLARLLSKASRRIVPVLLYYRECPLTEDERSLLGLAFRKHRLFAGTISPVTWSLEGGYLG